MNPGKTYTLTYQVIYSTCEVCGAVLLDYGSGRPSCGPCLKHMLAHAEYLIKTAEAHAG